MTEGQMRPEPASKVQHLAAVGVGVAVGVAMAVGVVVAVAVWLH